VTEVADPAGLRTGDDLLLVVDLVVARHDHAAREPQRTRVGVLFGRDGETEEGAFVDHLAQIDGGHRRARRSQVEIAVIQRRVGEGGHPRRPAPVSAREGRAHALEVEADDCLLNRAVQADQCKGYLHGGFPSRLADARVRPQAGVVGDLLLAGVDVVRHLAAAG